VLNIEAFLTEVSPDAPCGEDLQYDSAFIALEQKAKGTPEQQIGNRIESALPPNWKEVRKEVLELLSRTRDLRLLVYLTEALLHTEGLVGLQESLGLLQEALQAYWPSIHPQLDPDDDNDPTQRVNILMTLCDFDKVVRPISLVPLVESRALGRFNLRDVQIATDKLPRPTDGSAVPEITAIQAAFMDADVSVLEATYTAVGASFNTLTTIENFVTDQVGVGNAPNFAPLRDVLKEIQQVLKEYAGQRGIGVTQQEGGEEGAGSEDVAGQDTGVRSAAGQLGAISSRQDVIRALDLICDYYAKHEPSSPVPMFLHRAKRLVPKDFMEILKDLVPDGLAQVELIKGRDTE